VEEGDKAKGEQKVDFWVKEVSKKVGWGTFKGQFICGRGMQEGEVGGFY